MYFGPAPGSPGYTLSAAMVNLEVIDINGDPVYTNNTNIQLTEIPSAPSDAAEKSWGGGLVQTTWGERIPRVLPQTDTLSSR
jgi:hypothetical protein